jgi:beta-N-acetylhexosaminidase
MRPFARLALNLIVVAVILLSLCHASQVGAQQDPNQFIAKLVSQMTPDAKVGQLFIVAFPGTSTDVGSAVRDLVLNYHVGGVVLSAANGNIVNSSYAPTQVATLTSSLQNLARAAANVPDVGGRTTPFIPLFVALDEGGNGLPRTQLTGGMTPLPSLMALGATWKPDDAAAVGKVVGAELAAVGANMLLGPSLDVLDASNPYDAGVNVFGGDPYWVGVMGQNYVRGLHAGSENRVAAVLTNFPGQGSAPDADGVVDKSLAELQNVELVPFISMLQPAAGEPQALADALMTSHMRYRGFDGNIRVRTAPISVDPQAMQELLALPEVKTWRDTAGGSGVLVSGSLGAPLIRQYYDPRGVNFPAQKIALDALQAPNDVLVLSDFGSTNSWSDQLSNIKSVIEFFQEKYSTDLAFQARVDDAVARILRLKVRLYPGFDPGSVIVDPATVTSIVGGSRATTLQVAQDALTLLSPSTAVSGKPSSVPSPQDSVLIFTDDRLYKECSACQARPLLATDALQQSIVRLYPTQVDPARIVSMSYISLTTFLNGAPAGPGPDVGAAINAANWIIFAALDTDPAVPQSAALQQLMAQRPNLLTNKKVVVLLFDTPLELDPDIVSKATAVYALYSRTEPFVEVAARAIFGDVTPKGDPPVSVNAIHYQLILQTQPDPNQIIQILPGEAPKDMAATPTPVTVKAGDTLKLHTSVILDRNGHPVPDGTEVTFSRTFSQSAELAPLVANTQNGMATVSFVLDRNGPLRVRASSDPAMTSVTLQLTVAEQPSEPKIVYPPTPTVQPTVTVTSTPAPTETPTPTPTPSPQDQGSVRRVGWRDLLMALAGVFVTGGAGYGTQRVRKRREADTDVVSRALQGGLWSVIAGLTGYVLYGLGAPGCEWVRATFGEWAALFVVVVFGAIPVLIVLVQSQISRAHSWAELGVRDSGRR